MGPFIAIWVFFVFLGWAIGKGKGRSADGLILGLLLGIVGVVIIALMKPAVAVQAARADAVDAARTQPRSPYEL